MGLRRKSREFALQFLFSHDFQGRGYVPGEIDSLVEEFCQLYEVSPKAVNYGKDLLQGIMENQQAIDQYISSHSHNWRMERMSLVDRNLLRIAIFEMAFREDVPSQVAINEALEIAKRYSIDDSVSFINGILDAVQAALTRANKGEA
ncbi:transcription antitermination factor NusB [Desulfogranum japonicum]|uniref:transcription antitermination factor NusB n=1 Tax=Desulfogranum japonicum TaxID=231447 RepID=UPI0003F8E38B|nr:transcription antitermination factor NusB [Desulfogranum japonicum]